MKIKKCLAILLSVILICGVMPLGTLTASALTSGFFTYTVSNYEATITGYDSPKYGEVIIPAIVGGYKVVAIGNYAFSGCNNITSVTIQNGVKTVGRYAFDNCDNLTTVKVSKTVENLNYDTAFYGCDMLANITVDSNNSYYKAGNNVLYNKSGSTLLFYPVRKPNTDFIVPSGVTSIANGAFNRNCFLKNITIPTTVTNIGNGAFYECRALENVYITDMSKWCQITFGGDNANPLKYADNLYLNGELVTYIKFEAEKIGDYAFQGYKNLKSMLMTDSVTSIGKYAFNGCSSLENVTIPATVTSMGEAAFKDCSSVNYIYFNSGIIGLGITSIPYNAFSGCKALPSISIPAGVTSIASTAFDGCSSLSVIDVPRTNNSFTSVDGVLFDEDVKTLLRYPEGKTDKIYTIPNTVETIGSAAFKNCSFIENVDIPDSVNTIGSSAFYYCEALTSVAIPYGVTSLEYETFYRCLSLETVTLPSSIVDTNRAFSSCISIKEVYFGGTAAQWNAIQYLYNETYLLAANIHYMGLADADGSGAINGADLTYLSKELFKLDKFELTNPVDLDINGDGVFNIIDIVELKRILMYLV